MTNDEIRHMTRLATAPDRAETMRARIAEAAERLFRSMGYQKTAVADIARELGMSPANVYRFFPSKSAINEAIAARLLGALEAEMWAIARRRGPAPERLRDLLRHLHHQHKVLFLHEKRLHDMVSAAMAEHWGVIEGFMRAVLETLRHVVMDGMSAGVFARADPGLAAEQVKRATLAWTHPLLIAECLGKMMTEAELEASLEQMLDFVLRALRHDD